MRFNSKLFLRRSDQFAQKNGVFRQAQNNTSDAVSLAAHQTPSRHCRRSFWGRYFALRIFTGSIRPVITTGIVGLRVLVLQRNLCRTLSGRSSTSRVADSEGRNFRARYRSSLGVRVAPCQSSVRLDHAELLLDVSPSIDGACTVMDYPLRHMGDWTWTRNRTLGVCRSFQATAAVRTRQIRTGCSRLSLPISMTDTRHGCNLLRDLIQGRGARLSMMSLGGKA